jgi:hypothetical protein
VVFDPEYFIDSKSGRPVFRPQRDTALLHLGHPMFQRALASFARARFPNTVQETSRWTVRRAAVPDGCDALVLLTVEELAVNELRESFHHWIRTLQIPVRNGAIEAPLPHVPAASLRAEPLAPARADLDRARGLWADIDQDVKDLLRSLALDLNARLATALEDEQQAALDREQERFKSRQGELSALMQQQTLRAIEREIEELRAAQKQGHLYEAEERLGEMAADQRALEEELQRRTSHYEELRAQLNRERARIVDHVIPSRYTLRGEAQVLPVTIEIRVSGGGR